ncbi:glycosyl hydrolase family 18 protein [Bacillus sp. REN16]|uniref:glycosyl hydrolase family 18 protein n=1 Tax=Bacillus sp. REN16 TaxID=2887296 RepID=UPI001E3ACD41|nr:glycosyl hydrolase family 18 protein [Bacillus sp. REN16]MCC3356339.1 Ig-like domain-containing protein [Bacillus sp. REN16]
MSKFFRIFCLSIILFGSVFPSAFAQEGNSNSASYIDVTTIEPGGNAVKGSPLVTVVPDPSKLVQKVQFFAKAVNEPDSVYYPYAPLSKAPFSWSWATGDPWVPDGEYSLRVDITYTSGEVETVERNVFVQNYAEPTSPESPKDLQVTSRTASSVDLAWTTSTSTKLFNYEVYQDGVKIAETKDTSYVIEGLDADTLYQFRVKAKDIYNNVAIDDNSITVLTNETVTSQPFISEIQAPEPNGASPRSEGYSGTITVSVTVEDPSVENVELFVKTTAAPESDYWKFPITKKDGETYSVDWVTTSAPEGTAIIKAVATDSNGQKTTVSRVFLVDNVIEGYIPPEWDPADTPPGNYIIAYLAGWATLSGFSIMHDLDASRLTHVNYAFGLVGQDHKIKMENPTNDLLNFAELRKLKEKYPHLKTTIAVGGWGGSGGFSEASATDEARTIFADSVVDFITEHGFDGVDLDWEYPVSGGGPGTYPNPADKDNYPLLLEKIREKLDEQGEKDGRHYSLSIAGAANTGFVKNTTIGLSQQYLDYVQVMTYDIHGTWEPLADLNAPLYDDNGKTWSVDKAITAYLDAGVPAEKIVMGVPFYGYRYNVTSSENNGLRQPYQGSGSATYGKIMREDYVNNGYERFWDEGTQTPYLFNAEQSIFITYDDPESLQIKANYIRERGLGGAMIWEISQDHGIDLLDSLYQVLKDPIQIDLDTVNISITNKTLQQNQNEEFSLEGILANNQEADLTDAGIEWFSSDSNVAAIEDGKLTANNAGTTEIYAIVSYKGKEVKSNIITITVESTVETLTEQITSLEENGEIKHSLSKQLTNRLKQAEHHYQKGDSKQAIKHLADFVKHLNNSDVSAEVKAMLETNVKSIEQSFMK